MATKKASRAAMTPGMRNRKFDARPDRLDLRDLPYRPPLRSLPPAFPEDAAVRDFLASYVARGLVLDQGTEGACTGFGLASVVNYLFWIRHSRSSKAPFARVSPRMLYELAKRYDEWPGQDYEGSSCRGALKGWHKHGVCSEALWPYPLDDKGRAVFERPRAGWELDAATRPLGVYYRIDRASVVDLQAAIADIGAVYVSAEVHGGWDTLLHARATQAPASHAQLDSIPAPRNPRNRGGHAFALVGYNDRGFVVQNSWGANWGAGGFAVLPYDDWVQHATDAWAGALGVAVQLPKGKGGLRPLAAARFRVASGRSLTTLERAARDPHNPPDDPWPVDHSFAYKAYEPWSTEEARLHTLVSGNDGVLVQSDITRAGSDVQGHAREIVLERPLAWAKKQGAATLKLALYAHGGLNAEEESIRRIRVLAPYFDANGVYPLFLTWRTGIGESLGDMVQDWARKVLGVEVEKAAGLLGILGDAKDRAVEALAHVVGRGVWNQMRENAQRSITTDHGLDLVARNLAALAQALDAAGKRLELHLVGHSAGSILLGHLLERMSLGDIPAPPAKSCTLYAPACSTRFAVERYLSAADAGLIDLKRLALYFLSDENEKRDGLPSPELPAYGKSLLYLVSRALDDRRKMPLVGMERALLPKYAGDTDQWAREELATLHQWQSRWNGPSFGVNAPDVLVTKTGQRVPATHGSFDNNIDALTETLQRVAGKKLAAPMEWLDYE
jgi:hypothetical protein